MHGTIRCRCDTVLVSPSVLKQRFAFKQHMLHVSLCRKPFGARLGQTWTVHPTT